MSEREEHEPIALPEASAEPQPQAAPEAEERGLEASEAPAVPVDGEAASLSREEHEALLRERDTLREQILRKRAEFENYSKRVERDRQQAFQEATADLIRALLPTLDNLDRALGVEGRERPIRDGLELIRRELLALLEGRGLRWEDPQGLPFDPERHQALAHEPVPGFAPGTVVEVFRKAYLLGGRLLRPALVRVAKEAADSCAGSESVH